MYTSEKTYKDELKLKKSLLTIQISKNNAENSRDWENQINVAKSSLQINTQYTSSQ